MLRTTVYNFKLRIKSFIKEKKNKIFFFSKKEKENLFSFFTLKKKKSFLLQL